MVGGAAAGRAAAGDYRTIFRGTGVDFRDLREYEPGDDLRHIDWNVTARTDVPFVRQYTEDRELTAWLLLDRSASMGFGPTDRPKHAVLLELATTSRSCWPAAATGSARSSTATASIGPCHRARVVTRCC